MRLLHFGIAAAMSLAACSTAVTPSSNEEDSSSSGTSSAGNTSSTISSSGGSSSSVGTSGTSSGGDGSSSSFAALPDVDSSLIAGPADLRVSTIADSATLVLAWTDIASLRRDEYLGYKIYRSENYNSWIEVGTAVPLQQFFKDTSLNPNGQYSYLYRIAAFKQNDAAEDTLISKYSNQVGTLPITALGFGGVVFDDPADFSGVRWTPSKFEISWSHSGKKPEAGFVVQYMNCRDTTRPYLDGVASSLISDCRGDWLNLDTLGETDNHFFVYDSNSEGLYRVYAYYSDAFGNVISEFTPEINTIALEYHESILFVPPTLSIRVDSGSLTTAILPNHNTELEQFNNNQSAIDTVYYEVEQWLGDVAVDAFDLPLNRIITSISASGPVQCQFLIRARLRWIDQWGESDVSEWSDPSGTLNQKNIVDRKKICTE